MVFQNFIVLGIIPGTNIQINFQFWLAVVIVLLLIWESRRMLHSAMLAALLMKRALHRSTQNLAYINEITL